MRPAFAVRLRRDVNANAEADSAFACTLTSPLLRSRFLLLLRLLLPRCPPSLFRTLRAQCSCIHPLPPHLLPTPVSPCHPVPSSVLRLFPSQRVLPPSRHPRRSHGSLAIKFYIYYITPFLLLAPHHVDSRATFSFPPLMPSFSVCAVGLRIIPLRRSWISSENHLRPSQPFFSFAPSSRPRYQVLSPSLRVPAASFRFVEIYSHPPAFLPCFIPPRSTSALSFFLSVSAFIVSSRCLSLRSRCFPIHNFAFQRVDYRT